MCLVTEQKKPEVLKKDKKVYKFLYKYHEEYRSFYQDFKWKWDLLYKTTMGVVKEEKFPGKVVFADATASSYYEGFDKVTVVTRGFHAYTNLRRVKSARNRYGSHIGLVILRFTIPVGAKVFRDATGLIVSDKMILKREDNEN